jgi:hypothetical protein
MSIIENAHALIVGIADYHHITRLSPTVVNDARDVHDLLIAPEFCAYPRQHVRLLLNAEASQTNLRRALAELSQQTDDQAIVFIFFSGHGGRIAAGPNAGDFLLPVDVRLDTSISPPRIVGDSAISGAEFTAALRAIAARKVVVIFDCCHAGGIGQPKGEVAPALQTGLAEAYYEQLAQGRGRVILASSRSTEYSYVLPGASNSLFTHHLLAALRGAAPSPGGLLRVFDLFNYVQPRVTQDHPDQHPIFKAELEENFAVALGVGGKGSASAYLPPADDPFEYDVFVSYRQQEPDKTWVRKTLLPHLKGEGLRVCVDYQSFRLGAPLVLEMARAVEHSRYTLAVLSPVYLASSFTDLESVLAEHLGLERSQRRLLAVLREDCVPRLGIRARMWLDMTEDDEFDDNMARLIYELRQAPDA